MTTLQNPFRPGAGHEPPYLAGRSKERTDFVNLLEQSTVTENMILTGLRGIGKTVLMDYALKPLAIERNWLWVGGEFSETASRSEFSTAVRILTDLSVLTSQVRIEPEKGSGGPESLSFDELATLWNDTPGLVVDKLKAVLRTSWSVISRATGAHGLVFAYDEVQNLVNRPEEDEYPIALFLDTFQSLQRQGLPLMLLLSGLPNLFRKLVESRTYAERMFHVCFVSSLSPEESEDAIRKPMERIAQTSRLTDDSVQLIVEKSGGYPYFVQFICKEVYDALIQRARAGDVPTVPIGEIEQKLDADFFAGRWSRCTDRQRDLLGILAALETEAPDQEFAVKDIQAMSRSLDRPFSGSHIVQMLKTLERDGLVFKNRRACYAFAVPLLGQFIRKRQSPASPTPLPPSGP